MKYVKYKISICGDREIMKGPYPDDEVEYHAQDLATFTGVHSVSIIDLLEELASPQAE